MRYLGNYDPAATEASLKARINADPVATLIAALVTLGFDSYFVFH
jgi:hypothetical protein